MNLIRAFFVHKWGYETLMSIVGASRLTPSGGSAQSGEVALYVLTPAYWGGVAV